MLENLAIVKYHDRIIHIHQSADDGHIVCFKHVGRNCEMEVFWDLFAASDWIMEPVYVSPYRIQWSDQ